MKSELNEKEMEKLRTALACSFDKYKELVFAKYLTRKPAPFHKELTDDYQTYQFVVRACPRGSSKTTLTDVVYLSWLIITQQVKFPVLVSNTYSQAALFLENLKAELEFNEMIVWLYGKLRSDKWAEGDFETTTGVRVMAKGQGQQLRGLIYKNTRPDLFVLDDLEDKELVANKDRRDKLERWINSDVFPALAKPNGQIIYIGTILSYDAVLARILESGKYEDFDKKIYKIIDGDVPLWPEYMGKEEVESLRQDYAKRGKLYEFMAEYMNTPIDEDNAEFKRSDFQYYGAEDVIDKKFKKYLTIDPAISEKETSDNRALVVVGIDNENKWYILDKIVGIFDPYVLINHIFELHAKWKLDRIGIETVAFQKVLVYMLNKEMRERGIFLPLEELKSGNQKETRIRSLVSVYRSKSIYHRSEGMDADLEEELLTFPVGKRDDIADSLAYMTQLVAIQNKGVKNILTPEDKAHEFFNRLQKKRTPIGVDTTNKMRTVYNNF